MIRGKHLIKHGWKPGPVIGIAKQIAETLPKEMDRGEVLDALEHVRQNPEEYDVDGNPMRELAQAFLSMQVKEKTKILDKPLTAPIWGEEII